MSNKYLEKVADLTGVALSLGRVGKSAVKTGAQFASDTLAGATGKHQMDLINHHLFNGKGSAQEVASAFKKFNGLKENKDVEKFHSAIRYHKPSTLEDTRRTVRTVENKQLDDRVRSGIIGVGTVMGAKKVNDKIDEIRMNQQYGV